MLEFWKIFQGAIYSIDMSEEGYSTGSKDGTVKLWDGDFKPITSVNLVTAKDGYKGKLLLISDIEFC